jgi:bile acid:Na+ symporter, BASS family
VESTLISVGLPVSLAIIMFSLGLGLTVADFTRIAAAPKAFITGFVAQVILLPLIALGLLALTDLPPHLAFGVMILAFCPGGATTNLLSRFARADVALSVTLTAVVSLLSVVTVPLLIAAASSYFLDLGELSVDISGLAISLFVITTVPVVFGMLTRRFATAFTLRAEPWFFRASAVIFVVVLVGALAANWALFLENVTILGPILVVFNVLLLALGWYLARGLGLGGAQAATIAIEGGVQNGTLGITVASMIAGTAMPDYALPSAVYGITMYLITLPAIFLLMRQPKPVAQTV